MEPSSLYATLVLCGFLLIGIEIFLPGGILGIIGALLWLAAAAIGYFQFAAPWNTLSAIGLLLLLILTFIIWIRFFPKSRVGRGLTLTDNLDHSQSHNQLTVSVDDAGESISNLRPAGIAHIKGKRHDVMADADWIEAGKPIRVVSTQNATITVREAPPCD